MQNPQDVYCVPNRWRLKELSFVRDMEDRSVVVSTAGSMAKLKFHPTRTVSVAKDCSRFKYVLPAETWLVFGR